MRGDLRTAGEYKGELFVESEQLVLMYFPEVIIICTYC